MMMRNLLICLGLYVQFCGLNGFIIPDELPSLLSVIYSNIPTVKKGTDSRLGLGFRLGDRADFQVLLELGPQTNTQPLANQVDNGNNNKRNAVNSLANNLYAQRQQEKKRIQQLQQQQKTKKSEVANTAGGKWLESWKKDITQHSEVPSEDLPLQPKPGLGIGEIDAKSVIPSDPIIELEELRAKQRQLPTEEKPELPSLRIRS